MTYDKLTDEQRLMVLEWMREGLLRRTKQSIAVHADQAAIQAFNGVAIFDPQKVFNGVHPRVWEHYQHISESLIRVNDAIAEVKERLAPKYGGLPDDPEPEPAPIKKKPGRSANRAPKKGAQKRGK